VRFGLAFSVAVVLATCVPAGVGAQEELFAQGNQRYQEEDFGAAIEAYETVLSAGYESGPLLYNLGNAYFKAGELGRAILAWERARDLAPRDPDVEANLALAHSLTVDRVEPLPRFWLISAVRWWVDLLPHAALVWAVAAGWLALAGGLVAFIIALRDSVRRLGQRIALACGVVVLVLGTNLLVRELAIGEGERGVILADVVQVRSAPAEDDNLTLFEVHEGTRVRVDQRTEAWAEIVLADGKVGWVPTTALGVI